MNTPGSAQLDCREAQLDWRERIKKPAGCLHRDDLPVQFGLSRAAANGAAGRNA